MPEATRINGLYTHKMPSLIKKKKKKKQEMSVKIKQNFLRKNISLISNDKKKTISIKYGTTMLMKNKML